MRKISNKTYWLPVLMLVFTVGLFIQGCSGGGSSVSDVLASGSTTGSTTEITGANGGFVNELPDERAAFTAAQISGSAAVDGDATPNLLFNDGTSANAATYLDPVQCKTCHRAIYESFIQTNHMTAWQRKASDTFGIYNNKSIFGFYKDTYGTKYCVNCHTVNGAFVDANSNHAYDAGELVPFGIAPYTFASGTHYYNEAYTLVPTEYRSIQCENCHGPASLHVAGDRPKIVGGINAGRASTCQYCHAQYEEWTKSMHAVAMSTDGTVNPVVERDASGVLGGPVATAKTNGRCSGCHAGDAFVKSINDHQEPVDFCSTGYTGANMATDCAAYNPTTGAGVGGHGITCTTCHDPHTTGAGAGQLRVAREAICGKCHNGRYRKYVSSGVTRYDKTPGGSRGVHQPQSEMLLGGSGGVGAVQATTGTGAAYTYSFSNVTSTMTFSVKYAFITDTGTSMGATTCPDCHMYNYTYRAGGIEWRGHTFFPQAEACQKCHSGMDVPTTINSIQGRFVTKYNNLRSRLDRFLKANIATGSSTACVEDAANGYFCCNAITTESATRDNCALAEYNIRFMEADKSEGVHNEKYINKIYTVTDGLLKQLGY